LPHVIAGAYRQIPTVLAVVTALFVAGGAGHAQTVGSDAVIARVDGVPINGDDYALAQQTFAQDLRGLDEKARHDFITQYLIDVTLMAKEARRQNLALDEAALQRQVEFLRNKALMEKLLGVTAQAAISDEAVRTAYDKAVKETTAEPQLRLRMMYFKVADLNDEKAVSAAETRAKEAVERVKKGEDFVKVSEEMTGTSNPASLPEAGYLSRQQMKQQVAQVAFAMEVGSISAPIKTDIGWEVIRLEDKQMRKVPEFDAVRERFVTLVGRKAQLEMMEKLRSAAKIERTASVQPSDDQAAKAPK
jgi:peptidylprolyl isomerase/peptidyl-prolyl cis-trans isomerase C